MKFDEIYTRLCRIAGNFDRLKKFQDVPRELQGNLRLAELRIAGEEVVALSILCALIGTAISTIAGLLFLIVGIPIPLLLIACTLPPILYIGAGWYPLLRARERQIKGLGGVPRLLTYLTVKMQINPNLEKAANFAARNSKNALGDDLRRKLWKSHLRIYNSVGESLSTFSRKWGKRFEELSRSIQLIKSSLSERNNVSRKEVLERALESGLKGSENVWNPSPRSCSSLLWFCTA